MLIDNPKQDAAGKSALPLVRLQLALPFIQEMDRLEKNADVVLDRHGIARESMLDPNLFISANIIHRLLEDIAAAADDPCFGMYVGEQLDFTAWSPLTDAAAHANTLGDFLSRFILAASEDASSAVHTLEIRGKYTFFRERRVSEPDITPAQNDAFTAAYVLSILHRAVGDKWRPKNVLLQVCSPEALPTGYQGIQIVGGDNRGMSIRFPSQWLTHTINRAGFIRTMAHMTDKNMPPGSFLEGLWLTLIPRLDRNPLSVDHVAQLIGMSRQSLQRRLKASGTNLTQELSKLKKQRAIEDLVHTDKPVAAIGEALGFSSPASFTRAFKTWTGQSPREYRKAHEGYIPE